MRVFNAASRHQWGRSGLRAALALSVGASVPAVLKAEEPQAAFEKGAHQFCPASLTADKQSEIYSGVMALGASFTHGCMACEWNRTWQGYTELSDDQFWVRRNLLTYLLGQMTWKRPEEFRYEKLYVLENDGKTKPIGLVDPELMKKDGYPGEWLLDLNSGAFGWLSRGLKSGIEAADPELTTEALKVGGPLLQKGKLLVRTDNRSKGVLMRTVPGAFAAAGARPKSIYDLSLDGSILIHQFEVYADPLLVDALKKDGWRDPDLRSKVVESMAQTLAAYEPSLVIALDVLFWDTVFEALHRLKEIGPKSPLVRLALAILAKTPVGDQTFDQVRRQNQREDLLRVFATLSRGVGGGRPVPVLMARLADDPLTKFRDKNYMPVLATIFGRFAEQMTGLDFTRELLMWLNNIVIIQGGPGVAGLEAASGLTMSGERLQVTKKRLWDELGLEFDEADLRTLRGSLDEILSALPREWSEPAAGDTPPNSSEFSGLALREDEVHFSYDPVGGSQVTMLPGFLSGLITQVLLRAIIDVPGFVGGVGETFLHVNTMIDELHASTANNVHMLDVNEFYENLGYFLNPRTAHPSVLGARRMARMVEKTLCSGQPE